MTATAEDTWTDDDGRWHDGTCDGYRHCDTDPEDDRGESFDCLTASEEPCVPRHARSCGGCWTAPISTPAYCRAEHRAQVRSANAGQGLMEMDRLVKLGTMLQASLDASRDEHDAARRAVAAIHSTPAGEDPLPSPLHWEALDVVAARLHGLARADLGALTTDRPWERLDGSSQGYWRIEARELLVAAFAVGEEIERAMEEAGRRYVAEMEG
jgi:hypothetical protein